MPHLVNKAELGDILGKSQPTLTTWQKQGMPIHVAGTRGQENLYDTVEVIDWLIRRSLEKVVVGDDGEAINYEAERARLTKAQANHEELKVEVLKGELIRAEVVERVQGGMVSSFRARCLSLPTKAAPQLVGLDESAIETALSDYVYECLEELSDFDPGDYIPSSGAVGEAAAETDGKPVGGQEPRPERGGKRRPRTLAH
jgi:terminase small subunit / prophage DNA-packing protein